MTHHVKKLAAEATGPLKGIRVLDLTSVVFGSYAMQNLGDLGAEIIKVEFSENWGGGGDIMRWAGMDPKAEPDGLGPIFMSTNRNKRSWALDLKRDSDRKKLEAVLPTFDVFATNIRSAALQRLGVDYDKVCERHPDIIYAQGVGYGEDGPYAGEPAYDDLIQAASGLADIESRLERTDKAYAPSLLADKISALFFTQAVQAALIHRLQTGIGQYIEVPMYECMVSFNLIEHMFGHVFDPPKGGWTYSRISTANRKPFRTSNGHLAMLPYSDAQWEAFFKIAGQAETFRTDARLQTHAGRVAHADTLYKSVSELMKTHSTEYWIERLRPLGIPIAPVNRLEDLMQDEHLKAIGFFETYDHPRVGRYRSPKYPIKFSKTKANTRYHPPLLGEHNEELDEAARLAAIAQSQKEDTT